MRDLLAAQLAEHVATAQETRALLPQVEAVGRLLCGTFARDGRLYTFGNGGSAADAQHLAAELIGRYKRERRPLPAVALSVDPSVVTCIGNDYSFDDLFARQVTALARAGDVVAGFTTSGPVAERRPRTRGGPHGRRDDGPVRSRRRWRRGHPRRPRAAGAVGYDRAYAGDAPVVAASAQRVGRRLGRRRDRRRR